MLVVLTKYKIIRISKSISYTIHTLNDYSNPNLGFWIIVLLSLLSDWDDVPIALILNVTLTIVPVIIQGP